MTYTQDLKKNGFCKIGKILETKNIEKLCMECENVLSSVFTSKFSNNQNINNDYFKPMLNDESWSVLPNIIGRSKEIDNNLEIILKNKIIKKVLIETIGKDYKIWSSSIRVAKGNDSGLGFHTDSNGEVGLHILLEDQIDERGTTSLIPGSHLWNLSAGENTLATIPTKLLKIFSKSFTGKKGDVFIFFNKTLHGRIAHNSMKSGKALMIALFPVGYSYKPYDLPEETEKQLSSYLRKLVNKERLLTDTLHDDRMKVVGDITDRRFIDEINANNGKFKIVRFIIKFYKVIFVIPIQKIKKSLNFFL
tara:strand:+ start:175 stop:1092 length:918 start_codon:yes stop_codon:yes gene_type:complete